MDKRKLNAKDSYLTFFSYKVFYHNVCVINTLIHCTKLSSIQKEHCETKHVEIMLMPIFFMANTHSKNKKS